MQTFSGGSTPQAHQALQAFTTWPLAMYILQNATGDTFNETAAWLKY